MKICLGNIRLRLELFSINLIIISFLFHSCTYSDTNNIEKLSPEIIFIGGEITLGMNVQKGSSFVEKVRHFFESSNRSVTIINAAIRNEKPVYLQERYPKLINRPVDYLIIEAETVFEEQNNLGFKALSELDRQLSQLDYSAKIIVLDLNPSSRERHSLLQEVRSNSNTPLQIIEYEWFKSSKQNNLKHLDLAKLVFKAL